MNFSYLVKFNVKLQQSQVVPKKPLTVCSEVHKTQLCLETPIK